MYTKKWISYIIVCEWAIPNHWLMWALKCFSDFSIKIKDTCLCTFSYFILFVMMYTTSCQHNIIFSWYTERVILCQFNVWPVMAFSNCFETVHISRTILKSNVRKISGYYIKNFKCNHYKSLAMYSNSVFLRIVFS